MSTLAILIKKVWQSRFSWLIFLFFLGFLFLSPFLRYPAFNVIDDGASLLASQDLVSGALHHNFQNWPSILIETQEGRFRPVYHLYFLMIYTLFGASPLAFWVAQAVLLGATLVLMGLFLFLVTKNTFLSTLPVVALLAFAPTAENFYRFGTAETKQVVTWLLFLLWSWWVYQTGWRIKTMILGILILWLSLLTKETSITFVATFWFFWIWNIFLKKSRNQETLLYGLTVGLIGSCYFFLLPNRGGYNTAFGFNLSDMWLRFLSSWRDSPLLYLSFVISWLAMVIRWLWDWRVSGQWPKEKDFVWQCMIGIQAFLLLVVGILPWTWTLTRYFYPVYVMGILTVGLEVGAWWSRLQRWQKLSQSWQISIASILIFVAIFLQQSVLHSAKTLTLSPHDIYFHILVDRLEVSEIWLIFSIAISAMAIRMYFERRNVVWQNYVWQGWLVAMTGVSVIFTSLIWQDKNATVYLIPIVLVVIFTVIEIKKWWQLFRRKENKRKVLNKRYLILCLVPVLVGLFLHLTLFQSQSNVLRLFQPSSATWSFFQPASEAMKFSFDTYQISYSVIKYVLNQVPADTHLYIVENEYEVIFEIGLYASHFRQQKLTVFTSSGSLVNDLQINYPFLKYSADPVADYARDPKPKVLIIRDYDWQPIVNSGSIATISGRATLLPPAHTFNTFPKNVYWNAVR